MLAFDKRPPWLALVFTVRGSELPRIRYRLLAVFLTSIVLTVLEETRILRLPLSVPVLSLVGMALGIFLGFRNNTAYDRFWEGRKLWGQLVNTSRSLVRDLTTLAAYVPELSEPGSLEPPPGEETEDRAFLKLQTYRVIAFAHALRMQLRGQFSTKALTPYLSETDREFLSHHANAANAIVLLLAGANERHIVRRGLSELRLQTLTRELEELTNIQGGCERIISTPIPHSYSVLLHRIVAIYVFALPFSLADTLHLMTPLVVLLIAYTFLGLDSLGDELEDPFGEDMNDLPLFTICHTIEINLRQMIGERDVPPAPAPVQGLLL